MNRDLPLPPQRVLFASAAIPAPHGCSEPAEFIATLSRALDEMGHDVRLVVPASAPLLADAGEFTRVSRIRVPGTQQEARILRGRAGPGVTLYLVEIPGEFDRPESGGPADAIRYGLFSRIVALMAINQAGINWQPDLLHCAGWQSALAVPLVAGEWSRPATIYSMHEANHRYCQTGQINALALPVELLKSGALAMQGQFSFEKGAILTADELLLPSPGYREELLRGKTSHPLTPLLEERADRLAGIPGSTDYQRWSPTTDPHLEQHYDGSSFGLKRLNRQRLAGELELPLGEQELLFAFFTSGHDQGDAGQIITLLKSNTVDTPFHILAIANKQEASAQPLLDNAGALSQRLTVRQVTDAALWHKTLASSDCLLLPAPCYPSAQQAQCALGYGTVPIAHASASIREVVTDATPANLLHGTASGFLYDQATPEQLARAITRAGALRAKPAIWWEKLAIQGMDQSFHTSDTVNGYLRRYRSAVDNPAALPV